MPVYNVEKYLEQSLSSILSQSYSDIELIIINDGSDDTSDRIIQSYIKKDRRIKYLYKKNEGVSSARNLALNLASGQYVFFMDADDVLEANSLERLMFHIKHDKPDMLFFGYIMDSLKTGKKIVKAPSKNIYLTRKEFIRNFDEIESQVDINSLWNKAYNLNFLKRIGVQFPQMTVGEDALFNYYCFKNIKNIKMINEVYYHYSFERSGSAMNTFSTQRMLQKMDIINEYSSLRSFFNIENNNKIQIKMVGTFFGEIRSIKQNKDLPLQVKSEILRKIKYDAKHMDILNLKTMSEMHSFKLKIKLLYCVLVLAFVKGDVYE